jgi:hypothetical protein
MISISDLLSLWMVAPVLCSDLYVALARLESSAKNAGRKVHKLRKLLDITGALKGFT